MFERRSIGGYATMVIAAVAVALAAAGLAGCGGTSSATNGSPSVTTVSVAGSADGKTMAPKGAPYSYSIPATFAVFSSLELRNVDQNLMYRSVVGISRFDLISVKVAQFPGVVDAANIASYMAADTASVRDALTAEGAQVTLMPNTTVDGRQALKYTASNLPSLPGSPPASAVRILAYDGRYGIIISCQWTRPKARSQILAGCDEVLASMKLR
jgi:hypothetical protein